MRWSFEDEPMPTLTGIAIYAEYDKCELEHYGTYNTVYEAIKVLVGNDFIELNK